MSLQDISTPRSKSDAAIRGWGRRRETESKTLPRRGAPPPHATHFKIPPDFRADLKAIADANNRSVRCQITQYVLDGIKRDIENTRRRR